MQSFDKPVLKDERQTNAKTAIVVFYFDLNGGGSCRQHERGPTDRQLRRSTHHRSGANAPHSATLKEHHGTQGSLVFAYKIVYTHRGRRDLRTLSRELLSA